MATGLTGSDNDDALRRIVANCSAIALLLLSVPAAALDVQVIALSQGKAVVVVDGKKPRTLSAGDSTPEGVKLISATTESAVLDIEGKRRTLTMGQSISAAKPSGGSRVTLYADSRGHFLTSGTINGAGVRFMVDTGATAIAMSIDDARRAGVNYLQGDRVYAATAAGVVPAYKVKLESVRVGDIEIGNIDGIVMNAQLPAVLLGMSFLNRLEMQREGVSMTLIKKY